MEHLGLRPIHEMKEMSKISVLGELPSLVVAFETDEKAYCIKCKCKVNIAESQYKPYPNNRVLEKGICKNKPLVNKGVNIKGCGSKVRTFRKARYYSKTSYSGSDYHKQGLRYPPTKFIDLKSILGEKVAKRVYRETKYAPLRSITRNIKSITMDPNTIAKLIVKARYDYIQTLLLQNRESARKNKMKEKLNSNPFQPYNPPHRQPYQPYDSPSSNYERSEDFWQRYNFDRRSQRNEG